jgi:hypothetical protein
MMNKAPESPIGKMSVMDGSGHTELKWNMDRLEDIAAAKGTFDDLVGKGYSAFGSSSKTEPKHAIRDFDPTMAELVMVPRIVGG